MRLRVLLPVLGVLGIVAVALVAIATGDPGTEVADFGPVEPPSDGATLPADQGLDLDDVELAADPPPADPDVADATWAEVAAWIDRENRAGRAVVVNLFASWCDPCEREVPLLNEAAEEATDVAFLGVATNDSAAAARRAVADFGVDFPTVRDVDGDEVAYHLGSRGLPTTVGFDVEGRLVGRVMGELTESSLRQLLDRVG